MFLFILNFDYLTYNIIYWYIWLFFDWSDNLELHFHVSVGARYLSPLPFYAQTTIKRFSSRLL